MSRSTASTFTRLRHAPRSPTWLLLALLLILGRSLCLAEEAKLVPNAEREGWMLDPNLLDLSTLDKINSGNTRAGPEFGYLISSYRSTRKLGSPLLLTKNGNSWEVGNEANLSAELTLVVSVPRADRPGARAMAPLAQRSPELPTTELTVSLPRLGIHGQGWQNDCGIEYVGMTDRGIQVELIVTWNASVSASYSPPLAYSDEANQIQKNAARSYLQEVRALALAYVQGLELDPKARLKSANAASPATLGEVLELATDPSGKRELLPDGRDSLTLKVRALPLPGEKADATAKRTQSISVEAGGAGAAWIDLGKPALQGQWKTVLVQASNPDKVRGPSKPPASAELRASLGLDGQNRSQGIQLSITPEAALDAKPDLVEFVTGSQQSAQVQLLLENPGPNPWSFRCEYEKRSRPLAKASLKQGDPSHAVLTLQEAGLEPLHDGTSTESAVLRLFAEQKNREPVERDIRILIAQEGLFLANTGRDPTTRQFNVRADGKGASTDLDVRVYLQDPKTHRIINLAKSAEMMQNVVIEPLDPPESNAGRLLKSGDFQLTFTGIRPSNDPSAILRMRCQREIPWDGRTVPVDFRITYTGAKEEDFTAIFTVGLVTTQNGPGGKDWQLELTRCQEVINRFVPAPYRPKLQAMLDSRKQTLGAEGLAELRHRLWSAAVELTLGEGGKGYEDEARWANYITETMEWSEWAGDMAFGAAIGTYTGPYGAVGASVLKGMVISAINAYQAGQAPRDWLWENLCTVPGLVEGIAVDPDMIEKLGVNNKAKVWAIYVGYYFLKNLYQSQSLVEALKQTTKDIGTNALGSWLSAEVKQQPRKPVGGWTADKIKEARTSLAAAKRPPTPASIEVPTPGRLSPSQPPKANTPTPTRTGTSGLDRGPVVRNALNGGRPVETVYTRPARAAGTEPNSRKQAATSAAELPRARTEQTSGPSTPTPSPAAPPEGNAQGGSESSATRADGQPSAASTEPNHGVEQVPPSDAAPRDRDSQASERVRSRITIDESGRPFAHPDDVLAIMEDPSMVRSLKDAPSEIREAFSNTRECIYRQHDTLVEQHVKDSVPGMRYRMVKVMEFRTPGGDGRTLNTDRDYRVCYYAGIDPHTGQPQWIEVPRSHWEAFSYETFAGLTGGPIDNPAASRDWAQRHQQLATDKEHIEASRAFSDQKKRWNPVTRKFESVQVMSNFERVTKLGQAGVDIDDPFSLGKMYEVKVSDAHHPAEGFVQANKAVEAFIAIRKTYNVQGRNIGVVPDSLLEGIKAVDKVNGRLKGDPNRRDPAAIAEAERTLRQNGFSSLEDFMHKLGAQFESLKLMKQPNDR